jgi:hypothetical protein
MSSLLVAAESGNIPAYLFNPNEHEHSISQYYCTSHVDASAALLFYALFFTLIL